MSSSAPINPKIWVTFKLILQSETLPSVLEKTKISWWHIFTVEELQQLAQTAADTFVASHPNVEIEITILENESFKQKLSTSMQSGEPPDIFQSWGGGVLYEYADAGLGKDITADLATDGWGD